MPHYAYRKTPSRHIVQYCSKGNDIEIGLGMIQYFSLLRAISVFKCPLLSSNILVPNASLSRISFKEGLCLAVLLLESSVCSREKSLSKTNGVFSEEPHSYGFSSCLMSKEIKLEKSTARGPG